jgi:hypothetical protein
MNEPGRLSMSREVAQSPERASRPVWGLFLHQNGSIPALAILGVWLGPIAASHGSCEAEILEKDGGT